ncbi:MAG: right-handed parallel beta-helix repeat-containing protein [Bacteroidota bacterium]
MMTSKASRIKFFLKLISPLFLGGFLLSLPSCQSNSQAIPLTKGMRIEQSVQIQPGLYPIEADDSSAVLYVSGKDIVVDFQGAVLEGSQVADQPNLFKGIGIHVENGSQITIKNAVVRGFKIGLLAEGVDSLLIDSSDFSYNYRQRLKSSRLVEDETDWLSYHHNEHGEWKRYGAGLYLDQCQSAMVRNSSAQNGQNGLLLVRCELGLFYNNDFSFNSGLGIGLYRSKTNRILHNKADWNIRGYSYGHYNRGQDSAGLLAYEQSRKNAFAYNSATHCGDGFFLWAGDQTIQTGKGGSDRNLVYGNDLSYASNNGVEITFSQGNKVVNNVIKDCDYGVWGGYSYQSSIIGNRMSGNRVAVAIEHGNYFDISHNQLDSGAIGVQLWERSQQPDSWPFAQKRNVKSRNFRLFRNLFQQIDQPILVSNTQEADISLNQFVQFQTLFTTEGGNERIRFIENRIFQKKGWGEAEAVRDKNQELAGKQPLPPNYPSTLDEVFRIDSLPDGQSTLLPAQQVRGRSYILMTEWGPYNFGYPFISLRKQEGEEYIFGLFGPNGNWKVVGGEGFAEVNPMRGALPTTLRAKREADAKVVAIQLEYLGPAFIDAFGRVVKKGEQFGFSFREEVP